MFRSLCQMPRDLVITVLPFAQVQYDTEGYLDEGEIWLMCFSASLIGFHINECY